MLTTAFYYNAYRPYIYSRLERSNVVAKRAKIAEAPQQNKFLTLNKSHKSEIVHHARGVTQSIVGFGSGLRRLMRNMDDFLRYEGASSEAEANAKQWMAGRLSHFAENYTANARFMAQQTHSETLSVFAQDLGDSIQQNLVPMGRLGFRLNRSGALRFNTEAYANIQPNALRQTVAGCRQSLRELYTLSQSMLTGPLLEHMQFKALSYHYNYQLGRVVEDGFGIIESGILLDRIL